MFGLGIQECVLIFLIAVLIFGPGWVVKGGKSLGESVSGFAKAFKEGQQSAELPASQPKALPEPKNSAEPKELS